MATVFTGHSNKSCRSFSPQNIQRMLIVFGSGFYKSRSNQIRSLFGLIPSSEYKQGVFHIYSQSLETMRNALKANILKGLYHGKQDFWGSSEIL